MKWGLNVWLPIGESPAMIMANRVEMSLFDTWYLRDTTLIRSGIPELNLLNGAPSDITGGQPRHKIEFHTLYHRDAPDPIHFSSLGTADLRIFTDFGHLPWMRDMNWAQGARASLAVTNAFNNRQTVLLANGGTPTAFEPGFLDLLGRVLALTVRKIF